ncbi:hypothetical protein KUV80_10325 [Fictibacillus nanhaiensis]|uniref:DUF5658 family protein n=1 Tax=Fictibacillus nanhaiensis TaxID=742169 RepID=UPI001C98E20B|nr:DUF5658 family protein [Fictibacillus nanhaiensis]MBY6037054.1 hypothetical protein [Fictibacillus nanhaiensis]
MEGAFQFQRHLWISACLAILNMADALFTHQLLLKGGTELNPLMRTLYAIDPVLFLAVKFLFSCLILLSGFVPLHKRVRILLYIAFIIYFFVVLYHIYINLWLLP